VCGYGPKGGRYTEGEGKGKGRRETYLGLGVVLRLVLASDDGPPLVGVDQVRLVVADNTGRAGVDKRLHARGLARLNHGRRAVDIDLLEQRVGDGVAGLRCGGGSVDDHVRLDHLEHGGELLAVGDVRLVVLQALGLRMAVALAPQIQGGHGAVVAGQQHLHDVVAKEAAAADHEHAAELGLGFRRHGICV
jgi:hypothetical protein